MQAPPSSQGTLPHQESRRIVQDLFPERASIDDFRDADEAIPGAGANNGIHPVIDGGYHTVTDGIQGRQSAERGSSDTLRDEQRGITIPGETNAGYHGSSDTIKDGDKHDLRAHKDTPLAQNSSSTIGDGENQYRRTTMTHQADRASNDSSRDLEKGATGAKEEQDQINQDGEDTRQAQWENNVVGWDGPNDPENPHNWKKSKKYTVTVFYASMTFCITFASSVFSTATAVTAEKYGVSTEVMTLGTSLFVFGFAVGPIVWGPFSELYGRKIPLFFGFFVFAIFQIPVAVAQNVETIMLSRFLGGFFGSSPLAIIGGTLADFWGPVERGFALGLFAGATFIGPVAGPIVGGFITQSYLGWRWTAWITLIMSSFFGTIAYFICAESYTPVLLQRKAAKIRFESKNWAIHAPADENQINMKEIVNKYLLRPFIMLALEPILVLITFYMAFIYGMIYLFFEAYPIAFQEIRGWNGGVGALPFLGITIGVIIGVAIIVYTSNTRFKQKMEANGGKPIPEERLVPMIVGAFLLPIGLFWFAWTSNPHVSWVPQAIAGIPIGAGVLLIFLQGLSYIIDVYLMHANSALAANTLVRSVAGGGFPLFAVAMYHKLGVDWATSLLGFLTVAFLPMPILFFIYGKKLREFSRYSPTM
ncbi:hypothetical protein HO133_006894 [Letharia lupina]|uniref:Major facilitator superfamily (MFS) profile domain-containing protein n=1 Tax=Letharia lupina TaxID=560253 RepID=A0A8H6C5M5_9LECA|nr:uncharacterized protein HO133_006894 [Letharia lupina]KAF6217424.1 hypothetical protein HO133_006894 [Letharia lupina]